MRTNSAGVSTKPATGGLRDLFTEQVHRTPDAVALQSENGQLTYAELLQKAERLAGLLRAKGIGPDALVALHGERCLDYLVALVATTLAGGAYLPIDLHLPPSRIAFMLDDAKPTVVFSDSNRAEELQGDGRFVLGWEESAWSPLVGDPQQDFPISAPDDLAYVMYTSGSTGDPKGVCVCQRGVIRLVHGATYATFGSGTSILQMSPLSFDASTFEIWGSLLNGGRCVLMPHKKPSLQQIQETLEHFGITSLFLTSALFAEIAERRPAAFHGVREILTGGETIWPEAIRRVLKQNPGTHVIAAYGPTECTTFTTTHRYTDAAQVEDVVPLGEPIQHTKVYVVREDLSATGVGEEGELCVSGVGLARCYLNRPELTAQAFSQNPFADDPRDKLYRTGDRAVWTEKGELLFRGRRDGQIKLRGFRVELGEIEASLRGHEQVVSALVKTGRTPSGDQAIIAYVTPAGAAVSPDPELDESVFAVRTKEWQQVYSKLLYRSLASSDLAGGDPTLNAAGWKSSFDGRPISAEEMEEQVGETVRRIRALAPRRVLEIGCGTGMLLFRLAPYCESYVATDFSGDAIEYVQNLVRGVSTLDNVQLYQRNAHELPEAPAGGFDLVILNSVTEHFCSLDYLDKLIHSVANIVSEDGSIFVGDNRSHSSLRLFHASVRTAKSLGTLSLPALAMQVEQSVSEEEQMAIDPYYFAQLDPHRFQTVSVQLRRGQHHNEMTGYRFDATLVVGNKREQPVTQEARRWDETRDSLAALEEILSNERPASLVLTHLPNCRVPGAQLLLRAMDTPEFETVGDLRRAIAAEPCGQDPDLFWKLGERVGYNVQVLPTRNAPDGSFDVVFRHTALTPFDIRDLQNSDGRMNLGELANDPLLAWRKEQIASTLRTYLESKVPEYAVPAFLVVLPHFPLNKNGKIDMSALPMPSRLQNSAAPGTEQGGTALERQIRSVWAEILGIQNIGPDERFFEIGGDSLKAVRVAADLSHLLGQDISPALLFEEQTIRGVATKLTAPGRMLQASVVSADSRRGQKRRAAIGLRQYTSA